MAQQEGFCQSFMKENPGGNAEDDSPIPESSFLADSSL